MKGKSKPKMMAKKAMKKMPAKNDAMPDKGSRKGMMARLTGKEM